MPIIKKAVSIFVILIVCIFMYSCSASRKVRHVKLPPLPPPPPVMQDRDGDGIYDADDKCPDVAGVARYQGCPIPDTDGDNVNDEEDKCRTVKGPASNWGCPEIGEEPPLKGERPVPPPPPPPPPPMEHVVGNTKGSEPVQVSDVVPVYSLPKASIAYSYKKTMRVGETGKIIMIIQLGKSGNYLKKVLLDRHNQNEADAKRRGRADTTFINWRDTVKGYKSFKVIAAYDTTLFSIQSTSASTKDVDTENPTEWSWDIKALKVTDQVYIKLKLYGINEKGQEIEITDGDLPVTVSVKKKPFPYAWVTAGVLFVLLLIGLLIWLMARRKSRNKQIFFSYKWSHIELKTIVDELYISLKDAGFNVVKDKDDLRYAGSISGFMNDLSKSSCVIVAVSEAYLKSVNCMKELFHIYSNAGMNKSEFQKRIFPITTEQLNLSNLDVVKSYVLHWQQEEQKWKDYTQERNNPITTAQADEYEFTRRVVREISNLLSYLYDVNTLSIEELRENNFEKIKNAIRESINKNV